MDSTRKWFELNTMEGLESIEKMDKKPIMASSTEVRVVAKEV